MDKIVTCSMTDKKAAEILAIEVEHLTRHPPQHPSCQAYFQEKVDALRIAIERLSTTDAMRKKMREDGYAVGYERAFQDYKSGKYAPKKSRTK